MKDKMTNTPDQALVAPSDIADMAGVSRGAVSNWRKRADDFPQPVGGTATKPLFDRGAVETWLRATGKAVVTTYEMRIWALMNALRNLGIDPSHLPNVVLALACARKLVAEHDPEAWSRFIVDAEKHGLLVLDEPNTGGEWPLPTWGRYVHITDPMRRIPSPIAQALLAGFADVPIEQLASVADFILARVGTAMGRSASDYGFVGSRVSELLINIASPEAGGVIYDPAAGVGDALLGVVQNAPGRDSAYGPVTRVVGHDVAYAALEVLEQRAYLAGIEAEVLHTDVLRTDADVDLKADLIVCEPPFTMRWEPQLADPRWDLAGTPPRGSADLAWIQHCITHLSPGGRAYVVTPASAMYRGGTEGEIRKTLLDKGCIETVVALPGKMLSYTSIDLVLWALCVPGEVLANPGEVLLIDATEADQPEKDIKAWMGNSPDAAAEDVPSASVRIEDLIEHDGDVTPSRWLEDQSPTADATVVAFHNARTIGSTALESLRDHVEPINIVPGTAGARVFTVEALIKQGALDLKAGRPTKDSDDPAVVTARDIRDRILPTPSALEMLDASRVVLTEPGDVLLTTMNQVRALVDEAGGHTLGTGVYRLRVLTDQLSAHFVAAAAEGQWNTRLQRGSTIQRANPRELEIPVPTREWQDAAVAELDRLAQIQARATDLAQAAADLRRTLLEAIRYDVDLLAGEAK
jgi:hypothetical protein